MSLRIIILSASLLLSSFASAQSSTRMVVVEDAFVQTHVNRARKATFSASNSPSLILSSSSSAATVETNGQSALIAYFDGSSPYFRLAKKKRGRIVVGKKHKVLFPKLKKNFPYGVAVTATPNGFTVFYQVIEERDPSAAHTIMVELDHEEVKKVAEVALPWGISDAIWNGSGYHLALIYPNGPRLSMVSTNAAGQPQQHPDWASPVQVISDVHLVRTHDAKIHAYYQSSGKIFRTEVTQVRTWGSEPKAPKMIKKLQPDHFIAATRETITSKAAL